MSIERDKTSLLETAERVYQYMIREHTSSPDLLNEFDVNSRAWGMNINDWEWNPGVGVNAISAYYDPCPSCGGFVVDVLSGEELRVKELEVE